DEERVTLVDDVPPAPVPLAPVWTAPLPVKPELLLPPPPHAEAMANGMRRKATRASFWGRMIVNNIGPASRGTAIRGRLGSSTEQAQIRCRQTASAPGSACAHPLRPGPSGPRAARLTSQA